MKFPKQIYVTIENDGADEYLSTRESVSETAEIGKTRRVAVYELKSVNNVSARVVVESAPERARSPRKRQ